MAKKKREKTVDIEAAIAEKRIQLMEWVPDLEDMTCRNTNSKIVVKMRKRGIGHYGKVVDMPDELKQYYAAMKNGKRLLKNEVFRAEVVFIRAYVASGHGDDEMQEKTVNDVSNLIMKSYGQIEDDFQVFVLQKQIVLCLKYFRGRGGYYFDENRKYPQHIEVRSFPVKDEAVPKKSYGIRYDLCNGENIQISISRLCDEDVHVFMPDNRIMGVFFMSKDDTNDFLYFMDFIHLAGLLLSMQKDEEVGLEPVFDDEGNLTHFDFTNKC